MGDCLEGRGGAGKLPLHSSDFFVTHPWDKRLFGRKIELYLTPNPTGAHLRDLSAPHSRFYCGIFTELYLFLTARTYYRQQTKFAKVMFVHLSDIILFTGVGWYNSMHCRWYPSMPCSRGGVLSQHTLQQGGACSRGVCSQGGSAPGGVKTPLKADDYCCGRYASYWNAFLFS